MSFQLRQLKGLFRDTRKRLARRRMREEINTYFATGQEPKSDGATAYLSMLRRFNQMTDESIGGPKYDNAVTAYRQAQVDYCEACREAGL